MKIVTATEAAAKGLAVLSKTMGYDADEISVQKRLKEMAGRNDSMVLVAMDEGKIVGFIQGYVRLLVEVPEAVEIGGLAVVEDYQGKGVGKQLIQAVEAWARGKQIPWIVLSSNVLRVGAHGFYEHLGYKKVKQQFAFEKWLK